MRSFTEGWISSDYENITATKGISGWQSELLRLSSLNEEEFGFGKVIDRLLQLDDQELEIISRSVGPFYNDDVLNVLHDVFSLCSDNPLKKWKILGGDPESFALQTLLEWIEDENDRRNDELRKIAEPFEQQISELISTVIGKRPEHGITGMRIYDFTEISMWQKIIEIFGETRVLPTVDEITSLQKKGKFYE